jgi:hypothetical protein
MACAGLALAAIVAKAEADSVIGDATPSGQYTTGSVYGIGQLIKPLTLPTSALNAWTGVSSQFGGLWLWLLVQAGFDVVFMAGYLGLAICLIRGAWQPGIEASLPEWLRRWWLLAVLAAVNLAQAILSMAEFAGWIRVHRYVPVPLIACVQVAVVAKWVLVILLAAVVAYRVADREDVKDQLTLIARALKKQRFSVVIVALLALIAIGKGTDVLEQMPDVQRTWLTWPPSLGWTHLAFAVLAQGLLAVLLALLGVLRTQHSSEREDMRDAYVWWPWLLLALAVPAIALIVRYTGVARVSWYNVIPIPALAALAVIASWFYEKMSARPENASARTTTTSGDERGPVAAPAAVPSAEGASGASQERQERFEVTVATTGNMLAVAVIAVTGLGLVRSFTSAAMVVGRPYSWAFWIAVAAGFAVATLSWIAAREPAQDLADRFRKRYHSTGSNRQRPRGSIGRSRIQGNQVTHNCEATQRRAQVIQGNQDDQSPGVQGSQGEKDKEAKTVSPARQLAICAVPFAVADVLLVFEPMSTTHWLGVLATTVIAIGTLAVGLAVLAYLAQSRKPLPVFRKVLRLKSTPVISLVVIAAVAGLVIGNSSTLHDIRIPAAVAVAAGQGTDPSDALPTIAASLQQWLDDPVTTSCAIPAGSTRAGPRVQVMPLVLVAAAGGGIRAAWWTAQAMEKIDATPCGRHAVFAASGVSGGSVGLALTDTTADPNAALAKVAGPDGLAAAIDGLVLRDTIAGLVGLDFTAGSMPAGQRFPDRAGLLEQAWQSEDPALIDPFPLTNPLQPWRLLMNTTAVGTGCRAVIADLLIVPSRPADGLRCDLNFTAPIPDSYDFFAQFPCLRGIATVTAALLSARFPYVTPSGVVNACGHTEQYVDGGYADSTGLATIAGLLPQIMPAVRQYNSSALARPASDSPVTLIVPVTVYLGNSPQAEPVADATPGSPPQPLVPISSGASGARTQLSGSTALLQQISAETLAAQWLACTPDDNKCAQEQAAADAAIPQQLILVVPRKVPAVATPLGWVLSAATRAVLTTGIATEATSRCPDPAHTEPDCPVHVGRLGDLLYWINRTLAS